MLHARCFGVAVCVLLALPGAVSAESGPESAQDYEIRWSATAELALHFIASQEADDDVTGFFDQYWFTPNKDTTTAPELGLTEAMFDLLGAEETPKLRFRLASPTSNLGLTDAHDPFVNQRAMLSGRHRGLFLDLDYWRLRTDNLREFPDPSGSALTFTDLTDPDDRFFRRRTGFDGTLRFRPQDAFEDLPSAFSTLDGELELRGGYEARKGRRQDSFMLSPTNDWLSLDQKLDQKVGTVGGGLLVAPGGLFTLAFDADHQSFTENAPTLTDADLGAPFPSSSQTIGFVPNTNRTTGAIRLRSQIGERVRLRGGFQASYLEQVSERTPDQRSAGLDDNYLIFSSANVATDVALMDGLSLNAFFKYDRRDNHIDRNTALFNPNGRTQVDEFLEHWRQIGTGAEIVYQFHGRNRVSLGAKGLWVDRDLDFVAVPRIPRILPANALVADDTRMWTVYGRTHLRPFRGFDFRGEVGYRGAPETGYIVDLDDYVYGSADASYTLPVGRPVVLSTFVRGSSGENHDFDAVDGIGPNPAGARVDRDFELTEISWGIHATASPWQHVTLFSFFFQSWNSQDYDLVFSNLQRYLQDAVPLTFASDGPVDYRSKDLGVVLGVDFRMNESTDAGLSYAFNQVETRYRSSGSGSAAINTIDRFNKIDADIHRVGVRLGHQLREGLDLSLGYRFDLYDDHSPVHGTGNVQPFDLSTHRHTVTFGLTLSDAFLN